jgi:predicted nucleotide-binding protein
VTDLAVSRPKAEERIRTQVAKGNGLLEELTGSPTDLDDVRARYYTWDEYNRALLRKLFTTDEVAETYSAKSPVSFGTPDAYEAKVRYYREDVQIQLRHLTSVLERLDLFDEPAAIEEPASPSKQPNAESSRVFVVHGHDAGLKEAVARLIGSLGYEAVILHEKPNEGRTIIEKFERESPDAAFAVILLTPDDEGRALPLGGREASDLSPRARQNVVWEFGYFTALLGRGRVAALIPSGSKLERPSDVDGVLYTEVAAIDDGGWRLKLAREMKAAGLDIDLNKAE